MQSAIAKEKKAKKWGILESIRELFDGKVFAL